MLGLCALVAPVVAAAGVPLPVWHAVNFMQTLYIPGAGSYGAMPQVPLPAGSAPLARVLFVCLFL